MLTSIQFDSNQCAGEKVLNLYKYEFIINMKFLFPSQNWGLPCSGKQQLSVQNITSMVQNQGGEALLQVEYLICFFVLLLSPACRDQRLGPRADGGNHGNTQEALWRLWWWRCRWRGDRYGCCDGSYRLPHQQVAGFKITMARCFTQMQEIVVTDMDYLDYWMQCTTKNENFLIVI